MSINFNRSKTKNILNKREYKLIKLDIDPWDEQCFKNFNTGLFPFEKRMYKTWKHNRKKQYK